VRNFSLLQCSDHLQRASTWANPVASYATCSNPRPIACYPIFPPPSCLASRVCLYNSLPVRNFSSLQCSDHRQRAITWANPVASFATCSNLRPIACYPIFPPPSSLATRVLVYNSLPLHNFSSLQCRDHLQRATTWANPVASYTTCSNPRPIACYPIFLPPSCLVSRVVAYKSLPLHNFSSLQCSDHLQRATTLVNPVASYTTCSNPRPIACYPIYLPPSCLVSRVVAYNSLPVRNFSSLQCSDHLQRAITLVNPVATYATCSNLRPIACYPIFLPPSSLAIRGIVYNSLPVRNFSSLQCSDHLQRASTWANPVASYATCSNPRPIACYPIFPPPSCLASRGIAYNSLSVRSISSLQCSDHLQRAITLVNPVATYATCSNPRPIACYPIFLPPSSLVTRVRLYNSLPVRNFSSLQCSDHLQRATTWANPVASYVTCSNPRPIACYPIFPPPSCLASRVLVYNSLSVRNFSSLQCSDHLQRALTLVNPVATYAACSNPRPIACYPIFPPPSCLASRGIAYNSLSVRSISSLQCSDHLQRAITLVNPVATYAACSNPRPIACYPIFLPPS
jgi:hypothetical protein